MWAGPLIYQELSNFLRQFSNSEADLDVSSRVITKATWQCHKTQQKHFLNCITPPSDLDHLICDRFFHETLVRGSGTNENIWRHFRASFPELCGPDYGDAFCTLWQTKWNFECEMQFDPRWVYIPISAMHISLTQHLVDDLPSSFVCLPLALFDCSNEFGFTTDFMMQFRNWL